MNTRRLTESDIVRLKELERGFDWEFALDYIAGVAVTDARGRAIGIAGAWKRAETHMVIDPEWGTPGGRAEVLQKLHTDFGSVLKRLGYTQTLTWMDDEIFGRRLKKLGWIQSEMKSWHRGL